MSKTDKTFHVRFANLRHGGFDDRLLNTIQVTRLFKNEDIQVLYIKSLKEENAS